MALWRLFVAHPPLTDICTPLVYPPVSSPIQGDNGRADARPHPQHLSITRGSSGLDMQTIPRCSTSQGHQKWGVAGVSGGRGEWEDGGRYRADTPPTPPPSAHPREPCVCIPPRRVRQIADQCGGRVGVREQLLNESQLTHSRSEQRRTAAALTGTPHSYTENNIPAHPSRRARGEKRHSEWEGKQQKYISGGRRWDTSKRKRQ